jgi:Na+/H+-translocating membrane pyrophosphatase
MNIPLIIESVGVIASLIGVGFIHHRHGHIKSMHKEVSEMLVTIRHQNLIKLNKQTDTGSTGGNIGKHKE